MTKEDLRTKYERIHFKQSDNKKGKIKQGYAKWLENELLKAINYSRCCAIVGLELINKVNKYTMSFGGRIHAFGVVAELVNLLKIKIMKKAILALVVGLMSMALAWYWFSWKLVVVIFLALFGNNLQRSSQGK